MMLHNHLTLPALVGLWFFLLVMQSYVIVLCTHCGPTIRFSALGISSGTFSGCLFLLFQNNALCTHNLS